MVVDGVILAAGWSSRTAPEVKLGYSIAGRSLLEMSISSLRPFCARLYVVTGAHQLAVMELLRGQDTLTPVYNPDFAAGMYGSVKAGLRCTEASAAFVLPGDCPFASPEVMEALLACQDDVVLPCWKGQTGHPVLLRRRAIGEVLKDNSCQSLREFVRQHGHTGVPVDCPGILTDIDTPEDYRQALNRREAVAMWKP